MSAKLLCIKRCVVFCNTPVIVVIMAVRKKRRQMRGGGKNMLATLVTS